jgi:hypothetical protein
MKERTSAAKAACVAGSDGMAEAMPFQSYPRRVCFINPLRVGGYGPQGLKPAFFLDVNGTAEAVPYPRPICETRPTNWIRVALTDN